MGDVNVTFELLPSFYSKTDPSTLQDIIQGSIEEAGDELLKFIKEESPVRTGRLRDGHYIQTGNGWINIKNDVYYWQYVVYRGNDYLDRGLLRFIESQIIEERLGEKLDRLNNL